MAEEKKETKTENKKPEKKEVIIDRTFPEVQPGMTVKVHQQITETNPKGEEKQRIQIFEGLVIARKHGKETGSTITVRKVSNGVGVEKIFPLHLPTIVKIELARKAKVRRAKMYFVREPHKRLKETLINK